MNDFLCAKAMVTKSLLENTLCMIGFSGNDPNFNNWIGWIRDNLGAENAPYLYLLNVTNRIRFIA